MGMRSWRQAWTYVARSLHLAPLRALRAPRYIRLGIDTYFWSEGIPAAHPLKDMSATGAYICTNERWYPGTVLKLTLQCEGENPEDGEASLSLPCIVVRHGEDGIGVKFIYAQKKERRELENFLRSAAARQGLKVSFHSQGQALVETALVVPLLFFLVVFAVDFGGFIYAWITVADAARSGAQYAALAGVSAGTPSGATSSQVQTLVANETAILPNASSSNPTVTVCQNYNGTATQLRSTTACPSEVTSPPKDTETNASGASVAYTTVAVDVSYTFSPFIPGFSFPALGINLPGMPTSIHRRTVMRMIQ